MRTRLAWLTLIAGLVGGLCCPPSAALGQGMGYEVPQSIFTGPLSHPRYEDGGIFAGFGYLYWNTSNRILASQQIAVRGFKDIDGSITGTVGTFVGSGQEALNTNQLMGPSTSQPGYDLHVGWRLQGGVVIEADWKHLRSSITPARRSSPPTSTSARSWQIPSCSPPSSTSPMILPA